MDYQLIYTKRAVKDIRRLDSNIKQRIKYALEKYKESPFQFSQKLTNPVMPKADPSETRFISF